MPAVQINTGAGCHLDAAMVEAGLRALAPAPGTLVFVENVGNLVCPALFDLGERARVVIMSVTEGADKPLKYPHMFRTADLMLVNKIDLLPYVDFDVARCVDYARRARPDVPVLEISATRGDGLDAWYSYLRTLRPLPTTPLAPSADRPSSQGRHVPTRERGVTVHAASLAARESARLAGRGGSGGVSGSASRRGRAAEARAPGCDARRTAAHRRSAGSPGSGRPRRSGHSGRTWVNGADAVSVIVGMSS